MAKKRKNSGKKPETQKKKPFPVRALIAGILAVIFIASLVVFLVIRANMDNAKHELRSSYWVSQSAKNASGDEVDIREVYNVKYSNYQGRLEFDKDNRFEIWLSPGDSTDGTHSGTYEISGDVLTATFDEGTKAEFALTRKDGEITRIDVNYDEYTVSFFPQ